MRGLALALVLAVPLWAGIIVVAIRLHEAAQRGALPVLNLSSAEPTGGER